METVKPLPKPVLHTMLPGEIIKTSWPAEFLPPKPVVNEPIVRKPTIKVFKPDDQEPEIIIRFGIPPPRCPKVDSYKVP